MNKGVNTVHAVGVEASADKGAVTVLVAFAVGVLMLILGFALVIGGVASARHRADSAADLSALAAASSWPWGQELACDQARWVVTRMRLRLDECRTNGQTAHVVVTATVSGLGEITARAAAGPVAEMSPAEVIAHPIAGNGRPRAMNGMVSGSSLVGERYRRPVDVRLERRDGFTRRSLPTSCRQAVTTNSGRAV
nr:membrane spanning protein [Kibdelosporangium sp. MJ126-NF4]